MIITIELQRIFISEFFFSFIHLNCPLVVKIKKRRFVFSTSFWSDTPDDYIPHLLPYHWPKGHRVGAGQWKWGNSDALPAGLPINPCRIYHSNSLLPGQVWWFQAGTVTRWASLGPWEPSCHIEVMMKTDRRPAVRNHWDVGIVTAIHLSYHPKIKMLHPEHKPSIPVHDLLERSPQDGREGPP